MDENKWEYDYSSSNNPAGDTGYPNVGSSGMNTANTASTFNENTQPSGGATPPPAGPQNTAPAAPKKPKKNAGKAVKSIVALVLAAAMGFMGGFVGARFGGNNKVIIQQVERSDSSSADSESAAEGTTVSSGMTTAQVAKTVSPSVVVITTATGRQNGRHRERDHQLGLLHRHREPGPSCGKARDCRKPA